MRIVVRILFILLSVFPLKIVAMDYPKEEELGNQSYQECWSDQYLVGMVKDYKKTRRLVMSKELDVNEIQKFMPLVVAIGDLEILDLSCQAFPEFLEGEVGYSFRELALRKGQNKIVQYICEKRPQLITEKFESAYDNLLKGCESGCYGVGAIFKQFSRMAPETWNGYIGVHLTKKAIEAGHRFLVQYFIEDAKVPLFWPGMLYEAEDHRVQCSDDYLMFALKNKQINVFGYLCEAYKGKLPSYPKEIPNPLFVRLEKLYLRCLLKQMQAQSIGLDEIKDFSGEAIQSVLKLILLNPDFFWRPEDHYFLPDQRSLSGNAAALRLEISRINEKFQGLRSFLNQIALILDLNLLPLDNLFEVRKPDSQKITPNILSQIQPSVLAACLWHVPIDHDYTTKVITILNEKMREVESGASELSPHIENLCRAYSVYLVSDYQTLFINFLRKKFLEETVTSKNIRHLISTLAVGGYKGVNRTYQTCQLLWNKDLSCMHQGTVLHASSFEQFLKRMIKEKQRELSA